MNGWSDHDDALGIGPVVPNGFPSLDVVPDERDPLEQLHFEEERRAIIEEPSAERRADGPPPRFRLVNDVALEKMPVIVWLLHRVIGRDALVLMFGMPGSLKSFLALLLAFSVALGRPFHGRAVERGPVIYVAAEGAAGLSVRVRVLRQWLQLGSDPAGVWFVPEPVNLANAEEVEAFVSQGLPIKPVLVIFDTLSRSSVGIEENSATDMGRVIGAADYIRKRLKAAVLFIHHPSKLGMAERGSSVLRGAVDSLLQVARDDDVVTVTAEKLKDSEPFDPMHFRIRRIELDDGESSLVLEASENSRQAKPDGALTGNRAYALDVLRSLGCSGATFAEWRRAFPRAESTFQRCVADLRAWGHVDQRGPRYFAKGVA